MDLRFVDVCQFSVWMKAKYLADVEFADNIVGVFVCWFAGMLVGSFISLLVC